MMGNDKIIRFICAQKKEEDARAIMQWRNDPNALPCFFHSEPKVWNTFWREYCETYFLYEKYPPLFAVYNNERIGFLRFSPYHDLMLKDEVIDIGINLHPLWKNKGLGSKILQQATERMFVKGVAAVIAEIRLENSVSIRAFEKAGYVFYDAIEKYIDDIAQTVSIVRYIARGKE